MSPCTSSSISSRSIAAVPLGLHGLNPSLQGSQAGGVGGFHLLTQLFGLVLAATQVLLDLGLVAEIVSQGAMNIGKRKGVQSAGDCLRRHPQPPVVQYDIQGDTRGADTEGPCVIDMQRRRIGMQSDRHGWLPPLRGNR